LVEQGLYGVLSQNKLKIDFLVKQTLFFRPHQLLDFRLSGRRAILFFLGNDWGK